MLNFPNMPSRYSDRPLQDVSSMDKQSSVQRALAHDDTFLHQAQSRFFAIDQDDHCHHAPHAVRNATIALTAIRKGAT
jgi:hypothetical protein